MSAPPYDPTDEASAKATPSTDVLVVCDIRLYRDGLQSAIEGRSGMHVVGTAATPDEALEHAVASAPDIVLLEMGIRGAMPLIVSLLAANPFLKIVALGVTDEPLAVLACAEVGACGFVTREAPVEVLVSTLEAAMRGEVLCSPQIVGSLFRRVAKLAGDEPRAADNPALTLREREIVSLIDAGLSNKEIARHLRVKVPTVKNHVHHILEKLGVNRRGAAAALVRRSSRISVRSGPIA